MRMERCMSILLFLFIIAFPVLSAEGIEQGQNLSLEEQASFCLEYSRKILIELGNENFSVLRINNTLIQAENIFDAQSILKQKRKDTDFSLVLSYCVDMQSIKEKAFEARDEFIALKKFYYELDVEDMNTSSIDKIIFEIEDEIKTERYEKVKPLIDETYEEIINVRADYTTFNIFYRTVTRNLKQFLYENWFYIVSGFAVLIILFFIYKNTFYQGIIKWKVHKLNVRKKTLKGLIKTTQYEYFNQGKMSQGIYNIKIKKFAELIRDIDRQIPLLQERLFKILKKEKKLKKVLKKNEIV